MRLWAAGHLVKTRELITSGPYRYSRNPLYLGRLLIFTGLCVMATRLPYGANWMGACLGGWAIFFGYYLPRKERVEPARLREVPRRGLRTLSPSGPGSLFPALRPYDGRLDPRRGRPGRMLHNREHWMVAGLTLAAGLLVWRV